MKSIVWYLDMIAGLTVCATGIGALAITIGDGAAGTVGPTTPTGRAMSLLVAVVFFYSAVRLIQSSYREWHGDDK